MKNANLFSIAYLSKTGVIVHSDCSVHIDLNTMSKRLVRAAVESLRARVGTAGMLADAM
jgi:hypothetical protein